MHYVSVITPSDIGENSYLIGPRFVLFHRKRFNVYAKGLFGRGTFVYQYPNRPFVSDSYTMYAIGGWRRHSCHPPHPRPRLRCRVPEVARLSAMDSVPCSLPSAPPMFF